jgi:flavorubredoxin
MTEILDAEAIVFGSPTLNNGLLPTLADMLCYMKGLKPSGKIGAAFGSYGWSGEAVKLINGELEAMKVERVDPGLSLKYVPTAEDLARCTALGRKIGSAVKERVPE